MKSTDFDVRWVEENQDYQADYVGPMPSSRRYVHLLTPMGHGDTVEDAIADCAAECREIGL